jgi:hypothetical protein
MTRLTPSDAHDAVREAMKAPAHREADAQGRPPLSSSPISSISSWVWSSTSSPLCVQLSAATALASSSDVQSGTLYQEVGTGTFVVSDADQRALGLLKYVSKLRRMDES